MITFCYSSKHINMMNILRGFCCVWLIFAHINVNALGLGIYATAANSGDAQWQGLNNNSGQDSNTGVDRKEIGFVMDTAVAKDKLFNYRFQIGGAETSYNGLKDTGGGLINTFGFGIVRTPAIRLWLGPQIGYKGSDEKAAFNISSLQYGVVVGVNYHISESISIISEVGRRYATGVVYDNLTTNGNRSLYNIKEQWNYIHVGILYRIDDNF